MFHSWRVAYVCKLSDACATNLKNPITAASLTSSPAMTKTRSIVSTNHFELGAYRSATEAIFVAMYGTSSDSGASRNDSIPPIHSIYSSISLHMDSIFEALTIPNAKSKARFLIEMSESCMHSRIIALCLCTETWSKCTMRESVFSATYRILLSLCSRNFPNKLIASVLRLTSASIPMIVNTSSYRTEVPDVVLISSVDPMCVSVSVIASLISEFLWPNRHKSRKMATWRNGSEATSCSDAMAVESHRLPEFVRDIRPESVLHILFIRVRVSSELLTRSFPLPCSEQSRPSILYSSVIRRTLVRRTP